ncbi:MAG: Holliday junction resolvase RuvX [Pyrinomonadaceae bacterium]
MITESQPNSGRILGLDWGEKRIGVAISDELRISVRPLVAIQVTNWKAVLGSLRETIAHFDAKLVVIGWPLKMDGSEGSRVELVRNTATKLAKSLTVPLQFQDERLTSAAAEERLRNASIPKEEWKHQVDSIAASIILSDYIDRRLGHKVKSPLE